MSFQSSGKGLSALLLLGLISHCDRAAATTVAVPGATLSEASLDLMQVFQAAPFIYSCLLVLSVTAFALWLYNLFTLRLSEMMPKEFLKHIQELLGEQRYEAALVSCQQNHHFCASIIACGIGARRQGPQAMREVMLSEGQRRGTALWQRISLLGDLASAAPLLGLLGTVVGLFVTFYDTQRAAENIAILFDGLGIALGTTVAGLLVALEAMIFYTTLRFRVVRVLNAIEREVIGLVNMVDGDLMRDVKGPRSSV